MAFADTNLAFAALQGMLEQAEAIGISTAPVVSVPYHPVHSQQHPLPISPGSPDLGPQKAKPWDSTATLTEDHRGSFVKTRNAGRTQKVNGIDNNVSGMLED